MLRVLPLLLLVIEVACICYIWCQSGKARIQERLVCLAFIGVLKTDGFSALLNF